MGMKMMTEQRKDGGPAFPVTAGQQVYATGASLRDLFAITLPEPTREAVLAVMERERMANPHNEPYHNKVGRRGEQEIRCALRYEYADAMLAQRAKTEGGE